MRAAIVALFAALLTAPLIHPALAQNLAGRRAPSFSLPDSAFKQFDILDYRGRWLILNFSQTSCANCADVGRKLEAWKAKHGAKAAVITVVLTPPETQATVAKYVSDTKTSSPIVFDMSLVAMAYFKRTPANPAFDSPHIFAINPEGNIVKDWNQAQVSDPSVYAELDRMVGGAK